MHEFDSYGAFYQRQLQWQISSVIIDIRIGVSGAKNLFGIFSIIHAIICDR
jgi:hypothetical protein